MDLVEHAIPARPREEMGEDRHETFHGRAGAFVLIVFASRFVRPVDEERLPFHQLARQKPPDASAIRQAVENLARFLDSLSLISRRENLRVHDREQLGAALRALEAARDRMAQPTRARIALLEALRAAGSLYGRDAQLDAYLRAQRHFPVDWIADPELPAELDRLGAVLAGVSPP